MSARTARFEVVHSDAGWFARFRAANGRKVWQTETYTRRRRADDAVFLITGSNIYEGSDGQAHVFIGANMLEVRTVDERTEATS